MKTKTLTVLFALVMVLSMTAAVFAGDFDETWDENTVLTVFNDIDMIFPDLFADIDSDFLWADDGDTSITIPSTIGHKESDGSYAAKALANPSATVEASFDPCGDGLVKFDVTITKADEGDEYYGPSKTFYIREISAKVNDVEVDLKKCTSTGGDDCHSVKFNGKGIAHVTGYLYYPGVLTTADDEDTIDITIEYSRYMTPFMKVEYEDDAIEASGEIKASKNVYCQNSLAEFSLGGLPKVRAKYDQNTGEARFQATIINDIANNYDKNNKVKTNYVIPAEVGVLVNAAGDIERYTDYTCKYTVYNVGNAAPRSDYCEFGEGIALPQNSVIRFDITVDHLSGQALLNWEDEEAVPFFFRVGGMTYLVGTGNDTDDPSYSGYVGPFAAFLPVDVPCPPVTRLSVMDPLKPFMTFFGVESDDAIEPSGPYGVYEGGLWGMYQKCGKFAYMAVRLQNDGIKDEVINLNNVAVAINGGTPMSWKWVTIASENGIEAEDNLVVLEPGDSAIFIGRAKITEMTYQTNSDLAMTGAVNFLDYGFYVSGKVYSDHNNTNCYVAP